jgi:dihydrofolate reductase
MRKIIVYIATSADGFIARLDGSVDWLERPRPKGNYGMGVFYKSIDTILWGRKTCDMALDFQKKGVPGTAFDTRVKNYVFTRGALPSTSASKRGVRERTNQSVHKSSAKAKRERHLDDGRGWHHCVVPR